MHPLALELGSFSLNAFGGLACAVLASAAVLAGHSARRRGVSEERALTAFVVAALAALMAAYAGYALGNAWSHTATDSALGGLHGSAGLVGALCASHLAFRGHSSEWRGWLDAQAPVVVLALCLGQLGCYLLGADYGTLLPPDAPSWLQTLGSYPRWSTGETALGPGAPAWLDQLGQQRLEPGSARSLPVHPTQLYIGGTALVLLVVAGRVPWHPRFAGQGFLLASFAYAALMVVFEPLRDDPRRGTLPLELGAGPGLALALGGITVAIVHGPLCALGSARQRRVLIALLAALSVGAALLAWRSSATSEARPLALSCLLALVLACYAALAWRRWSKRGFDAHIVVASGPHVPPGFTPGGPLQ